MDDLRAAVAPFDADAPLTAAPDPWDYLPMPTIRPGPPWAMAEMISAEPALVRRIVDGVVADGTAGALAAAVRRAGETGAPVVVTGCGTSEHAAMGAAAILREAWGAGGMAGWGPFAVQAFELAQDPASSGLVIGVSHEGGTAATIAALDAARAAGAATALLTASAGAPAGASADTVLATVEMDRSWCHTVGYVSPLAAAYAVAALLAGETPDAGAVADRVAAGIEASWASGSNERPATTIGRAIGEAAHLLVIGSGVDRITARELTLKVEEASYVPSAMRDLETFLHGHLPATGGSTALVLVLTERSSLDARATRARQALAAAAATGIRAGAILGAGAAARIPVSLTPAGRIVIPEAPALPPTTASLFGAAGPLQLVTLAAAEARGTNPDPIRRDDPVYLRAAELADDPSLQSTS
jgi:fructoselysine-6-P-deglycase FrlB-like protein